MPLLWIINKNHLFLGWTKDEFVEYVISLHLWWVLREWFFGTPFQLFLFDIQSNKFYSSFYSGCSFILFYFRNKVDGNLKKKYICPWPVPWIQPYFWFLRVWMVKTTNFCLKLLFLRQYQISFWLNYFYFGQPCSTGNIAQNLCKKILNYEFICILKTFWKLPLK